jgi:hypothetical protein
MRALLLAVILSVLPQAASAGPIAKAFRSGFAEVAWGTRLANLVEKYPGGDQVLTRGLGCRVYLVRVEDAFLGISRPGSTTMFALWEDNTVAAIGLDIPYQKRDQLLNALEQAFGPYVAAKNLRGSTFYIWKEDEGIGFYAGATRDPRHGVLNVWIVGPKGKSAGRCDI